MTTKYRKLWALTGLAFFVLVVSSSVGVTQVNFTLTVTKAGTGSGTVTSDPPGINCGTTLHSYIPARYRSHPDCYTRQWLDCE
jgi:hypothetical protein